MTLPPIVIEEHEGIVVVREDLIPGGTKVRALPVLFNGAGEYVYASPVFGYAQIAIARAATAAGKKALIFCARRKRPHVRTQEAFDAGANIFQVDCGYMTVLHHRAKKYCDEHKGTKLLPFGLDAPEFVAELARLAREIPVQPKEVWCAAGSGVLARALQAAWPDAAVNAVRVGAEPDVGKAKLHQAPETFEQETHQNVLCFFKGDPAAIKAWPVPDFGKDALAEETAPPSSPSLPGNASPE